MKIYMVRHGETIWNRKGKVQGQVNIPLTKFGRRLAMETGYAMKDIPFDIAFTSPLSRAKETLKIIRGKRKIETYVDKRLIEMAYGEQEGCSQILTEWFPFMRMHDFFKDPLNYVPPRGAESYAALDKRCEHFLEETIKKLEKEGYQNVLITAHGCLIQAMICHVKRTPLSDFWKTYDQEYCAVTSFECMNGKLRVLKEGEVLY